ncbi:MAG: family 10 glycosylhydrolase [Lachnospiraceae bacterium]|nr:family 10 glycosylhydrolase [Lachnospiraceae bacterium]
MSKKIIFSTVFFCLFLVCLKFPFTYTGDSPDTVKAVSKVTTTAAVSSDNPAANASQTPSSTVAPTVQAAPAQTQAQATVAPTVAPTATAKSTPKATPTVEKERRAVWLSFIDLSQGGKAIVRNKSQFTKSIKSKFSKIKKMNMTDVVVHVRPCSDAFYNSKYFPTSYYISGKQGKKVDYDPLEIMVKIAHKKGLKIEAWINPYRVTLSSTSFSSLSSDNPARIWHNKSGKKRNVLVYGNQIFYNPAKAEARKLIINGAKEIVQNYDVDGIHMDDYFYPSLSSTAYSRQFDYIEYNNYVKKCKKNGESAKGIVAWRRNNVNKLVRGLYSAIKDIDSTVEFGISPAGNIDNLIAKNMYYVDIEKWCNNTGFVDYIAPQIYWDFDYGRYSYDTLNKRWRELVDVSKVRLYSGIGVYRCCSPVYGQFAQTDILKKMVRYTRTINAFSGFYFYSYNGLVSSQSKRQVKSMLTVLK